MTNPQVKVTESVATDVPAFLLDVLERARDNFHRYMDGSSHDIGEEDLGADFEKAITLLREAADTFKDEDPHRLRLRMGKNLLQVDLKELFYADPRRTVEVSLVAHNDGRIEYQWHRPGPGVVMRALDKSGQIESAGYEDAKNVLVVKFRHGGTYHYFDVPPQLYHELMRAPSPGGFLASEIKGRFQFEKQPEPKPPENLIT